MNRRLQLLQFRKEALTLRAELERLDLAGHLAALRGPSEATYKGLRLISLLRAPVAAFLASRFGGSGASGGMLSHLLRYVGMAVAGWRVYRGARELFAAPRRPSL